MGIPNYIYDDANSMVVKTKVDNFFQDRGRKTTLITDAVKLLIKEQLPCSNEIGVTTESNNNSNNNNNNSNRGNIPFSWKLGSANTSISPFVESLNDTNIVCKKCKDGKRWLYYDINGEKLISYNYLNNKFIEIIGLKDLKIGKISSVDCNVDDLYGIVSIVIGLTNGGVLIINCVTDDGNILNYHYAVVPQGQHDGNDILDVWASLLPEYCISFSMNGGIIISKATGNSYTNFKIPLLNLDIHENLNDYHAVIDFPQFTLFNDNKIWHCNNVLDFEPIEVKFILKLDETIQKLKHISMNNNKTLLLLLETNQRVMTIPTTDIITEASTSNSNWNSNTHTVFCKTEWNTMDYQITNDEQYLFVCEQHVYDTCLTIYEHSDISNEWLFLGYTDIRAKYNVNKVLRLSVTNYDTTHTRNRVLSLLSGDGNVLTFDLVTDH